MSDKSRFGECVRALLSGKVICQETDEILFQYLEDELHKSDIRDFLARLDLTLGQTRDRAGYFCAYADPEDKAAKRAIRSQFERLLKEMEGLVAWLILLRSTQDDSRPLKAGDLLREAELLEAIEASPELQKRLEDVVHHLGVLRSGQNAKGMLNSILKHLVKHDYLKEVGAGSHYRATAKWSLLYDQLEFIRQHEDMPEAPAPEGGQGELFDG